VETEPEPDLVGTGTFCLSGTGTGMCSRSGSGFESGAEIKWNDKSLKSQKNRKMR
jgi:hypothetical protein